MAQNSTQTMEKLVLPEMKITGSRSAKPTGVELEVSKMGVLGQKGMSDDQMKAIERMLKTLDSQGK